MKGGTETIKIPPKAPSEGQRGNKGGGKGTDRPRGTIEEGIEPELLKFISDKSRRK